MKFNLITQNFRVTRTLIYKNNFTITYNNCFFYDYLKIKKKIKLHINQISKVYNIIGITCVGHGSACFYIDKNNVIHNGFHFSSKIKKQPLALFHKHSPKFSETFTPNYKQLHNLGKNFFLLIINNPNIQFMTLTSFIGWLFSNKNITDPSYISCHSYLWNFKKKEFSSLVNKVIKLKTMPKVYKSGKFIGKINNNLFKINKNCKIYNGMHDTSAAFSFHRLFFDNKKTIFLSTGTTFVFGKFYKKLKKITEKSKFYYLNSPNFKEVVLSRRFHGGLLYKKLINKKDTKSINNLLAVYTIKELKHYLKDATEKQINLVIDGPFSQNKDFLNSLKRLKKNMRIYCAKNKNTPSLGVAYLSNKKKINLRIDDYYNKI